ncbi:MAG TPA: hypothetical protein DDW50_11470 [Firmicutes bacterium]|jgi:hypothetical protein|nr:hypothetical protein [Bacillota bacterium]
MFQRTDTARMNRVRSMLKGLTAYLEQLDKYGANPGFLASLALFKGNLHQIQEYRKTLKKNSWNCSNNSQKNARVFSATAAKNCNLKKAEHLCSKARKWVRREFPAEVWPEFGFRKGEFSAKQAVKKEHADVQ